MDKIRVSIENIQTEVKIPTGIRLLVRRTCNAVLTLEEFGGPAEIGVRFANDEQMRGFNEKYRGKDTPTDVLSFPLSEPDQFEKNPETGAYMLGDIMISMERAVSQAEEYGHSLQREMAYLTAHSMLHLLGYDHEKGGLEAVKMREKEEAVLTMLGLPRGASYVFTDDGI